MIELEYVKDLLKKINACISRGDYYSVKELVLLETKNINQKQLQNKKKKTLSLKKEFNLLNKNLECLNKFELIRFIRNYSNYLTQNLYSCNNLNDFKDSIILLDRFIKIDEKSL